MSRELENRCKELVEALDLASAADIQSVTPLTGGVASDIAAVDLGDYTVCVKFALEKLRVAEDWYAPVDRNGAEYGWLQFAARTVPGSAPGLFGRDAGLNGFAMEFLAGPGIYLWKKALLQGRPVREEATLVADALGRIHAASSSDTFDRESFQNQEDFYQLRLEPYLAFTASKHPDLQPAIAHLIDDQQQHLNVLVHGDVSPKNIMFHLGLPVFLDAECATMGDASFDLAFCLNHLALKSVHLPAQRKALLSTMADFWSAYAHHITWEQAGALEQRLCALLPCMMLARVDGKSPVEYLSEKNRDRVRQFSRPLVAQPTHRLSAFIAELANTFPE